MHEGKVFFPLQAGVVSPRFIASADIHLGEKLYNIPELEEDLRDNFVRLCDLALAKKVECLVICGDLFENNSPSASTVSFVKEQVSRLYKEGTYVVGIAGDHDKPINNESWCKVSGIMPITTFPEFAGVDYYDYSSGVANLLNHIKDKRDPAKIQWIFLHGQFPQFFQFVDDKKKLDFTQVDIFREFPSLQGIIAGDIHDVVEGEIAEKDRKAYIGYTGSLGVTDMSDIAHEKSVIYCDGKQLIRIPFSQRRGYARINFKGDNFKNVDLAPLVTQYKDAVYRPVFSVEYDADSEPFLPKIRPLYSVGHVRTHQRIRNQKTNKEEMVSNVRSEMKTEEKISLALKESCNGNQQIFNILSEALSAPDPKVIFDEFKQKAFA